MKTIITLLLIILSLRSFAQETANKVLDAKKDTIAPAQVNEPKLILIDDSSCTARAVKRSCTFAHKNIEAIYANDIRDIVSVLPGVYQRRRGDDVSFFGARANSTVYIVDGVQLQLR